MKTTIELAPDESLDTIDSPEHPDGEAWVALMRTNEGVTFADSFSELIGELIEGYDDIPHDSDGNEEALWQRYQQAVQVAGPLQAAFISEAADNGFDVSGLGEDALTALMSDRDQPVEGVDTWAISEIPLVLIESDYAPFRDAQRPSGNIIWLKPVDERHHLETLASLGLIELLINSSIDEDVDE